MELKIRWTPSDYRSFEFIIRTSLSFNLVADLLAEHVERVECLVVGVHHK